MTLPLVRPTLRHPTGNRKHHKMTFSFAPPLWLASSGTSSVSMPQCSRIRSMMALCLLLVACIPSTSAEYVPRVDTLSQSELFEPVDSIKVLAPTHFPKPTHWLGDENVTIIVKPSYGQHRPNQDAVLAYAEGYRLSYYIMFLDTLTKTGFRGDVVLAIAEERILKPDVLDYLLIFTKGDTDKPNVVVYQQELYCDPKDGAPGHHRALSRSGDTDVFQFCQLPNVYGWKKPDGTYTPAPDPREGRVVATIRYEWYWIWASQYSPSSWIMLIDSRDSFFQRTPFANLPRTQNIESVGGLLYFFGENANATRLGISKKNQKWIKNGYGDATIQAVKDKPTICSGSTMGEQIAIETYLRAMVNEHDEAQVRMTGSDQGFHNYLYYSSKLTGASTIRKLIVWEQGRGFINNMGALRTKPFKEWGCYDPDKHVVYQWDGSISPVVHQWDRDKELHGWMNGEKHREYNDWWQAQKQR